MQRKLTVEEYDKLLKSGIRVICFGAGKFALHLEWCERYLPILHNITCFVDNDSSKIGGTYKIGDFSFPVISFSALRSMDLTNTVFLITTVQFEEFAAQIDADSALRQHDVLLLCHFYYLLSDYVALQKKIPANLRLSREPQIPKKIHYCWFGGNPIPERYKNWMSSWKKYCPDYEIIEWNETNYDITKNKYMKQAYEAKKWGFVPDYARLDIIYQHGGIYLDTDVELVANLDDLLYQEAFCGFESNEFIALGLGFGAKKGSPIIKEMMDDYDSRNFINDDGSLNLVASPRFQTNVLLRHGLQLNGEYQVCGGMTVYPEKSFAGMSVKTLKIALSPYTKSIHHYDGSWQTDEMKMGKQRRTNLFGD